MAGMSMLPASEEELRSAIQSAVRSVADDFRLRTRQSLRAPPSPSGGAKHPLELEKPVQRQIRLWTQPWRGATGRGGL